MAFVKEIKRIVLLLVLVFGLTAEAAAQPQGTGEQKPDPPPVIRQMIIIVIDGLQADSVSAGLAPNINGLGLAGIMAERVSVMPPDSPESRFYSLLCGTDLSGESSAEFHPGGTLLTGMEKKGIKTALIDGTGQFTRATEGISQKYTGPFKNDGEVVDRAVEVIRSKKPFLTVVVLSGPGKEKALTGITSRAYLESVTAADNEVGRLFKQLHIDGVYEESLLAVTGTTGKPPLVVKGKDFLTGTKLPPVCLKDLAPTLGYLYGINMPDAKGLVMWNALSTGPDRAESFMRQKRINDLSQAYADMIEEMARLENEKLMVQEEKARLSRDKQSIEDQIAQRDSKIKHLGTLIAIMKITGILGSILFIAALVVEYRILKKRYLFFT